MNILNSDIIVICLGDGSDNAHMTTKKISQTNNLVYNGILDQNSVLSSGCWHTSIYDIKLTQLKDKLDPNGKYKIIVLDQTAQNYNNFADYNSTIDMAQKLSLYYEVEYIDSNMKNNFIQILKTNKSFCILPFIGINVENQTIRNCCWQKSFRDSAKLNFITDPGMNRIRTEMLDGIMVESCQVCYDIEKVESISPRLDYTLNWIYKLGYKNVEDVSNNIKLRHYEINLGNKCNAMCRTCNPKSSHLIDKEYNVLGLTNTMIGLQEYNHFTHVDIDSIMRLHVAGGESTTSTQFENFLKICIMKKRTDFEIYVSTNAYAISNRFVELIKQFKNLKFSISVDGFEDINFYVRYPIKWQKFCDNIEKLMQHCDKRNFGFNTVVSIYNISSLYDLYSYIDSKYPDIYCNMTYLTEPSFMVPWNFADKDLVLQGITKIKSLNLYKKQEIFRSKIDGLENKIISNQPDLVNLKRFFSFNDQLDRSRNLKLERYIPELENLRSYIS